MSLARIPPSLALLVVQMVKTPRLATSALKPPLSRTFVASTAVGLNNELYQDDSTSMKTNGPRRLPKAGGIDQLRNAIAAEDAEKAINLYRTLRRTSEEEVHLTKEDYFDLLRVCTSSPKPREPWAAFQFLKGSDLPPGAKSDGPSLQFQTLVLDDLSRRGFLTSLDGTKEVAALPDGVIERIAEAVVRRSLKQGDPYSALELLKRLGKETGNRAFLSSYSRILQHFRSREDYVNAIQVYRRAQKAATITNGEFYANVMQVTRKTKSLELTQEVWAEAESFLTGALRTRGWNCLLEVTAARHHREALEMFRNVVYGRDTSVMANVVSFETMMLFSPNATTSMEIFDMLLEAELEPNLKILTSLVSSWCNEGNWGEAWRLANTMKDSFGVEPDERVFWVIYKQLGYLHKAEAMDRVLQQMEQLDIKPGPIFGIYRVTTFLKKNDDLEVVDALLEELEREGVVKDVRLFCELAETFVFLWDLHRLDSLIREYLDRDFGTSANTQFFGNVLKGYAKALSLDINCSARLAELRHLCDHWNLYNFGFRKFKQGWVGYLSSKVTVQRSAFALYHLANQGDLVGIKDLVHRLPKADVTCWNWVLVAHTWAGDLTGFCAAFHDMETRGVRPDIWTRSIQVCAFAEAGETIEADMAMDLLLAMRTVDNKRAIAWADRVGHAAFFLANNACMRGDSAALVDLVRKLWNSGALDYDRLVIDLSIRRIGGGLKDCPGDADAVYEMLPARLQNVLKGVFWSRIASGTRRLK